jgi:branched-chain amino acid transport system substrate-binding protein
VTRNRKGYGVVALVLLLALVLTSACGSEQADGRQPLLVIGLFNLTGDAGPYDSQVSQAVALAIKEQNAAGGVRGQQVLYKVLDGAGEAAKIIAATSQAISQNPVAIIGFEDTESSLTAAPLVQKAGIPFITVGATSPRLPQQIGDMVFLTAFGDNVQAAAGAEFLYNKLNARRIAVLTNVGNDYAHGLSGYFQARWRQLVPAGPVLTDTYQANDTDFSAQFARLKAIQPAPDAIYLAAYSNELETLLPAIRAAGFQQPILGGDAFDGAVNYMGDGAKEISNVYYTSTGMFPPPDTGLLHDFVAAYTKEYSQAPNFIFPAVGYDGARVLLAALNRAADLNGATIRAALEATQNFAGTTGAITFGPAFAGHVPQKPVTIVEIKEGQPHLVSSVNPQSVPAP